MLPVPSLPEIKRRTNQNNTSCYCCLLAHINVTPLAHGLYVFLVTQRTSVESVVLQCDTGHTCIHSVKEHGLMWPRPPLEIVSQ